MYAPARGAEEVLGNLKALPTIQAHHHAIRYSPLQVTTPSRVRMIQHS